MLPTRAFNPPVYLFPLHRVSRLLRSASLAQLPATDDPLLRAIGEHNAAVVGMESDAVTGLA